MEDASFIAKIIFGAMIYIKVANKVHNSRTEKNALVFSYRSNIINIASILEYICKTI